MTPQPNETWTSRLGTEVVITSVRDGVVYYTMYGVKKHMVVAHFMDKYRKSRARDQGYYVAGIVGVANSLVIIYWDGENWLSHGHEFACPESDFAWIADEPINLGEL